MQQDEFQHSDSTSKEYRNETQIKCRLSDEENKFENCEECKKKGGDEQVKFVHSKKLCDN